jgi:PhzF family phenazine biosynthesis protein
MSVALFHVDAFATEPFTGNPAAVCVLDAPRDEKWMQGVAREMNLSETAFVECGSTAPSGGEALPLRWFTPLVEVDLCGHATLAAAHVLWETGAMPRAVPARFATRSGVLTAGWRDGRVELDFPSTPCEPAPLPSEYLAALGIERRTENEERRNAEGGMLAVFTGMAGPRHVIELASEAEVRAVRPDFRALSSLPGRGLAVTARGDGRPYDFVSRYFAPWVGVDEDPVTGTVHCGLAVYWAARLGKTELLACQASPRGGEILLRLSGSRVVLAGRAVTVAAGRVFA